MNIPVDKRFGMLKTSAVAAACLTLMSFLVACGGGAGSANSSPWEKAITPPKLTGISPATGPTTGGTTVAITGTDIQKGATVVFGNVPAAKINSVTSTSIEAVTPVHNPGNVDVKITNPDTGTDTLLAAFAFEGSPPPIGGPAPTVNSVLPNSGPVVGGTVVTITGTDFQSGATVTFGQSPAAAVVFSSATQLLATTPAHAPGTVDVIVRNPDTQSATVSGGFTYQPVPAPTIISLLPTSGPEAGGTLVTVWGTNFLAGATVSFGGVTAASVTVTSATQLGAVTPPHATGVVDVRVTNPDDQFATLVSAFTYGTPPPTITGVSPNSGTIAGGTSVTITGTGFQPAVPGTTVTFGAVAAIGVNVLSSTKIQVTTPAHAAGAVDVKVTNPDSQSVTLPGGYTYVTRPIITGLSVDSGLSTGGTPVTIFGSNFAGGATVTFGTLPAPSVDVVSATQINVTTPAQPAGTTVSVAVTNPDTQFDTRANAFRYGQVLFSDGFESGDFSAWDSAWASCTVVGSPSPVHSGVKAAQIHYRICGFGTPPQPTLSSVTSGSLPASTVYVKLTYVTPAGETTPGTEQGKGQAVNTVVKVTGPPAYTNGILSATGYNVYAANASGTETLQNAGGVGCVSANADGSCVLGTDWQEPGSGLVSGAAMPTQNLAIAPPKPSTSQTAGGGLGVRTYYVKLTYTNSSGETFASASSGAVAVSAGNLLVVSSPPSGTGYTGYNVHVGASQGSETRQNGGTPVSLGSSWTEPVTGLVSGAALPTSQTACGGTHQDQNANVSKIFNSGNGFPNGLEHFFVRGWVYFPTPLSTGTSNGIQRKVFYLKGPGGGPCGDHCWAVVATSDAVVVYGQQRLLLRVSNEYGQDTGLVQGYNNLAYIDYDIWYYVELEVLSNSPTPGSEGTNARGNQDGGIRWWIGTSPTNVTQIMPLSAQASDVRLSYTTGISKVEVGRQADRLNFLPVDEFRYWDDVIVADAYIGP